MTGNNGIQGAIDALVAALAPFGQGDAAPFAALWSHGDDVTIYGGYGAYERGWAAVSARLAWAASRFAGAGTGRTSRWLPGAAEIWAMPSGWSGGRCAWWAGTRRARCCCG